MIHRALLREAPAWMTLRLRRYQIEAVEAVYQHLASREDNPCVVLPTGAGKSLVAAQIVKDSVERWQGRVLILAHVRELLEQTAEKIMLMAPEIPFGIYSAGLGSRDATAPVVVAGIQSAYRNIKELGRFDLVLVDEAHRVPPDGEGTYRTLLQGLRRVNPSLRLVGLTATPYRTTAGLICTPENLLNHVCYEISVKELIVQGYLSRLTSKTTRLAKVDTSALHVRAGEFVQDEVDHLMNQSDRVALAVCEIGEKTQDRKGVLVFASGIEHARNIARGIGEFDARIACIFGKTPSDERAATIRAFKRGEIKYLVNVGVLTEGFDAPGVDCVAILRPTMSPGLFYQMTGRGFRLAPGKENGCLILDFGGNILRHGPVDVIRPPGRKGQGNTWYKECPQCQSVIAVGYGACPDCGYVFDIDQGNGERRPHGGQASDEAVLSGEVSEQIHTVLGVSYYVHEKHNAKPEDRPTMRVEYEVEDSILPIREWVCFEHSGYAGDKASRWWRLRTDKPAPWTVEDAVQRAPVCLKKPTSITVRRVSGDKFPRVVRWEFVEVETP